MISNVNLWRGRLPNLELRGYEKSSFRPSTFMAAFKCRDLLKLKNETSVSDEVSSGIDYRHDDDSYILCSRDLIYIRWTSKHKSATLRMIVLVWYCLIIVWWSTTRFRSHSNQNFWLANPKLPRLLDAAGHWYSLCAACMSPSCMNMAGPAACGCQGVAQPDCRGPRRNSAKRSCLPWISTNGSLQWRERYHNTMTAVSA